MIYKATLFTLVLVVIVLIILGRRHIRRKTSNKTIQTNYFSTYKLTNEYRNRRV